jgi:hypothetical protein
LGYSDGLSTLSTGRDKPLKVKKTDSDDSDDVMYKNPGQAGERNIGNVFRKVRVLDVSEIEAFKALELYQQINEYVDKNDQNIWDENIVSFSVLCLLRHNRKRFFLSKEKQA